MEGPNSTLRFESLAARLPGAQGVARVIHGASRFHWKHVPWLPGKWRLKLGGSFLDVGAHVGYYTLIGARALSDRGRVHALEPVPRSFALLKKNVESNQLENVVLNTAACWSTPGEVTLHEASAINSGKSSVIVRNANSSPGPAVAQHTVRAVTVDQYVAGLEGEAISVIKVDVKGCEADVLEGAWKMLDAHQPVGFLEVMPHLLEARNSSASDLVAMLRTRGYRCHLVDWDGPPDIERGSGNVVFTTREERLPDAYRARLSRLTELHPALP